MGVLDFFRRGREEQYAFEKLTLLASTPTTAETVTLFLNENPPLKKKFISFCNSPQFSVLAQIGMARFELSQLFIGFVRDAAVRGDMSTATGCAACAQLLAHENVYAIAAYAEIYLLWEDQIAARYAERALRFEPPSPEGPIGRVLADPEVRAAMQEMNNRMSEIIAECHEHPEWRDSYPLKKASGLADDLP